MGGLQVVPRELLERVAAFAPKVDSKPGLCPAAQGEFDVDQFLQRFGIEVRSRAPWNGGRRWVLSTCPFNSEHADGAAYVVQFANGKLGAGCHHNSCAHWGWVELRQRLDPTWREGTSGAFAGFAGSGEGTPPTSWPDPKPLPDPLPPVDKFDPGLLPVALRGWLEDVADRVQCPLDYVGVGAVVSLAALVGPRVCIRPKRCDDWLVVPNLWGAIVGRPSMMKSPALQEALRPLRKIESRRHVDYRTAKADHEAAALVWEARQQKLRSKVSDLNGDVQEATAKVTQHLEQKPAPPRRPRLFVNDSTIAKLGEILRDNPNGVLVFRDELMGFLASLEKEGNEEARGFYLEAWSGTGSYVFDRIERGTIELPQLVLSVLGGIQPGPLSSYFASAMRSGAGDDGFMQRFQLTVYPDAPADWVNVDRWPDTDARRRAYAVFDRIAELDSGGVGAEWEAGDEHPLRFLRFDDEAQSRFDDWRSALEMHLRSEAEHEALESHFGKYRSLIPSLALIFHLVDVGRGSVGLTSLERAIAWDRYLRSHARRVYSPLLHSEVRTAQLLVAKLKAGKLQSPFALRDVYQNGWAGLTDRAAVGRALTLLVDFDWLAERVERGPGRPSHLHEINPKVVEGASGGTCKTNKRVGEGTSDGFAGSGGGASPDARGAA